MRYIGFIFALCLSIQAIASNTLTLSSVSGTPQTEVEVAVSLDNTDTIVALEMVLPLGGHLSYSNNSATLAAARSNGHQISAAQVGQELRIYVYSLSQNALNGNTGELLTFRLLLGNEPANYALTPTVVLSNAQGTSIAGSVQAGSVAIQAPKLQIINSQIDYGHIPIRATYTKNLQLKNAGTLPLTIENITPTNPLFVPKQTTLTIAAQQTAAVTIEYAPTERGAVSAEVMVKSNAINGEQVATIMADPFSVNELHVGTASGIADSIVTISLTMNNMEPIVAMQCAFKLPKQLEYVANSLAVNTTRANGHQVLSTLRGDTLFLAIFSMSNQPLLSNDGEVATFQLRLNGSSGTYYLQPIDVVLSNITEENMVSATSQGSVRINAPSISSNASISFGNVPITEVAHATYSVRNNGSAPLVLERATFLAEGYSIVEELPITIANYQTTTITVAYQPTKEGDFSTTMNLYTNDPNNRLKTVALSGHVFEPNALSLMGESNQDGTYTLSVAMDNYTDIVAVQYDLHWRSDMTTSQAAFKPSERMPSHSYSVTPLGDDTYQIIIYSMSNATIAGKEGELHQLVFTPQGSADYCGDVLTIDNIVLSNANGTDKASQSTVLYHFPTKQYSEQTITVCDQYVYNNKVYQSSGTYIDTLQTVGGCDSIVTTHLTVFYSEHEEFNVTACDQYEWHGNTYTQSGDYEYRTTITHVAEKLYVGYNAQNDPIVGLVPPRGISRFTVDGYITSGSGACFVGTGSPENGAVNDNGDLRIFDAGCFYYDRMSGRNSCFFYDFREAFNIEFGNYYAKNIETGEYYFNAGENVYEYSNTEYPITLFYKDYGKIHKVQFFDNNNLLWADINAVIEGGLPMIKIDYYEADGTIYHTQKFTENLYADSKNDISISHDCERVEILHLTINHTQYAEEIVTACDSYTWTDGKTYTESGTYYQYLQTVHGCDSTAVLHLTINNSVVVPYEVATCDSYTWSNGITYTQSGVYYDSLKTIHGCDSIEILTLTINYSDTATFTATACDSYVWHDKTYTTSGVYEYLTQTINGCDSLEVLTLTINNSITTEQTEVSCDSYTWTDGNTYTESGTYYQYLQTVHGCDSTVVLHLTINNSVVVTYEVTTCDSYTWSNGVTYTQSGIYYDSLKTIHGCDSVEILTLTINYSDTATFTATACDSYTWHDETYTTSGTYEYLTQTVNGCDSLEVLTLTINNSITTEQIDVACDGYTWTDGNTYTESGTYYQYLQTVHGCDSTVVLHLTINNSVAIPYEVTTCDSYTWSNGVTYTQSGVYYDSLLTIHGCDSVEILTLTINYSDTATFTATACGSYTWHDETYTTSGVYEYLTQTINGCDSLEVLTLTINNSITTEQTEVACDSYTWNGETYTESGEYVYTTTGANGCDSIVTLHLTINHIQYAEETVVACDSYTWNGETYTASGEYIYTTTAANGCDSIVTLHLTINRTQYAEETVTACDSYTWNSETYTESGEYVYTTTATNGCDSIVTLHLTINATKYTEETVTACDSYTWNSETYTESGEYVYTTTATNGCDSIVTLHLTINATKYAEETVTACDSYVWNGETYTASGEYTYTTTATNGCDSIVTLHLTINQTQYTEESVVACDNYVWNGETYTESGDYTYTTTASNDCDSIVTLHLTINATKYTEETVTACDSYTWNGENYTESGEYTCTTIASNGCDSIVTLHLTINESEVGDTEYATICYGETYTWNGHTYAATGEYSVTLTNAAGCDSIATLHLTIMPEATTTTETVVIGNDELPYTWRGNTYLVTGRYTDVEQYAHVACDSAIHVLDLTVLSTGNYDEQSITICETEAPYTWYGESYSATGKYTYTEKYVGTDIDSIQHILNLIVNPTVYTEETMVACDSYEWNGQTYTQSGDYVYTTTAANGCDSIVTLHLTINQTQYAEVSAIACDSYTWNSETYTTSGEYTYTTTAANGCDSIVTLHLTINATKYTEETATACDSYTWNGKTYTESGEYTYTTIAANGCDSIATLHLTINATKYTEETATACDNYTWNGETYTTSGEYTYTTTATNGCDSIVTLHLTINESEVGDTEYATICYGETYTWNGQTYAATGEYSVTLTNAAGCDSIATLHLTIMPEAVTTTESVVIGSNDLPYTWRSNTYLATGRYTDVEQYAHVACDSAIHVLDLTVLTTGNFDEESVTICETEAPYIWFGESYTTTGKYTYTEKYAGTDIDSVQHILNLTVNPIKYTEETVTACDSYTWNGETYTESGEYTYTTIATNGCDSIVTLHLTINATKYTEETVTACDSYTWTDGKTYTESGTYYQYLQTVHGCDSIVVLHLTILPDATTETETLALCPSELPYEWYGQVLTEAGTYSATEQYAGMECDSVIHELTLDVYVQTLPVTVTLPIVRTGEAIDVSVPTAEIQAHIAAETWYAPNALVAWYIMENSDWAALSAEPVAAGIKEVILKYAVETDCGNVESDKMVITVETTDVENIHSQSPISNCQKILYEDHIYILRDGKIYSVMGQEL